MTATNMAVYMAQRKKKRRNLLIEMSGGKCVRCASTEILNFDHKEPKDRSFRLNGKDLDGSWNKILDEWKKCQLLCRKCHLLKTKENGEYKEPVNKGVSKYGEVLPKHGCESAYARGCRCSSCCKAKHDARVARGELKGIYGLRSPNQQGIDHGTRRGYRKEKRLGLSVCEECRVANCAAARIRKQKKKLLACGEKASFSAVTGASSVRIGLGQPV